MVTALLAAVAIAQDQPNIVFILADDLGYGELGAYGQTKIQTPNLDRMAREGIRFTQHYSGSPVCAPSRCTLLTGLDTGHAYVRDNFEMGGWERNAREGQLPLPLGTPTVARFLKQRGYATGAFGKWGLGGPDSTGHPNHQGFDEFYGVLCQRVAHNHYPTHLWRNQSIEVLKNEYFSAHQRLQKVPEEAKAFEKYTGAEFAGDKITEAALGFIRSNAKRPFFAYIPYLVPHAAIQVPGDSLREYEGMFEETPYLGQQGYLPHRTPRAGYAAMITRMDRDIGRILATLKELKLDSNTIVFFSSDNGPTFNGGTDSKFFNSAGPLRDLKTSVYEGGIRVPLIARWPGRIEPNQVADHVSAFWDFAPTVADLLKTRWPHPTQGISYAPTLLGSAQAKHRSLYWEFASGGGRQAMRIGDWKAVRVQAMKNPDGPLQLFNLRDDVGETKDLVATHPEKVAEFKGRMAQARTPSLVRKWNYRKEER